jgi:N-acyl-phosphatidylethanolamine-hydrolysing phospholipase D
MQNGIAKITIVLAMALGAACAEVPERPSEVRGAPRDDRSAPFSAVWIGHATVLMRFGATTLLADPNLADHIMWLNRLTRASMTTDELPPIDAVILSHMHFDHFDAGTVRRLGVRPAVIFPSEGAVYADEILQPDQRPLTTWDSTVVSGIKITAVPARHQGGRYGIDALWNHAYTGYVLEGAGKRIYFAGDTGWDAELFAEIGKRFPGIDLAFIPIAPSRTDSEEIRDAWGHVGPRLALHIMDAIGAKAMVPIHYEAFFSTGAHGGDARRALMTAVTNAKKTDQVYAIKVGERVVLPFDGAPVVLGKDKSN